MVFTLNPFPLRFPVKVYRKARIFYKIPILKRLSTTIPLFFITENLEAGLVKKGFPFPQEENEA